MKILFCNFVISHICSTYSSCQKGTTLVMMEMQCTVKEWVIIIWLKKAHDITNGANSVHSERLGIYNLTKKEHDSTNDVNAVHSETMGVYNLAKKENHIFDDTNAVHTAQ
jgi:hypothetical protein